MTLRLMCNGFDDVFDDIAFDALTNLMMCLMALCSVGLKTCV